MNDDNRIDIFYQLPIFDEIYLVKMYDLLLMDVHSKDIHEIISEMLKIKYLSDSYIPL